MDLSNKTIKKTIDNMIGRSAHIQFLESDALAKTLVYCFDHLFAWAEELIKLEKCVNENNTLSLTKIELFLEEFKFAT